MERVIKELWRVIALCIISPLVGVIITTLACSISGLWLTPYLISVSIAALITFFNRKTIGPIHFGPGLGGAVAIAPMFADFGLLPGMYAVGSIGLLQIALGFSGILTKIKLPEILKTCITFSLGAYLLHKKEVLSLGKTLGSGNLSLEYVSVFLICVLFAFLAIKPMVAKFKRIPIGISHVIVFGILLSVLTISITPGEPTIYDKLKSSSIPWEVDGWASSPTYWLMWFVLLMIEAFEGYFNYKSGTHISYFEEPKHAINRAFIIAGSMNFLNAWIKAGPVMTGLIRLTVYQENGGQCNRKDLGMYLFGTVVISALCTERLDSFVLHWFTQWLFGAIIFFVGAKLIVKSIISMIEHKTSLVFASILVIGVLAIVWFAPNNQLIYSFLYCLFLMVPDFFKKKRLPKEEKEENFGSHYLNEMEKVS